MSPRRSGLAVLAALVIAAGCSAPDRSDAADDLGDRIQALPGIANVSVFYNADTAGSNESLRLLAITDPEAAPADACAAVQAFGERFADTEITGRAEFEVRDTGGSMNWSFTVLAAELATEDSVNACVTSQQARSLEGPYTVRATAGANGGKPGIIVNYRDGAIPSAAAGLDRARETVAAFDDFTWLIYVICGDALCDSAEG